MTTLENLVQTPLAKALGWALFHSLWEGAIVALVLLGTLWTVRSANLRYVAACIAMLAMLAGFALTLWRLLPGKGGAVTALIHGMPPAATDGYEWLPEISAGFRMADVLPWFTPFWIAGVVLFQIRGLVSWMAARRIRHRGVCRAPGRWQQELVHLREAMLVSKPVALLESCLTDVPVVIGYLRPAILVPIGMLAGMPANQVEAILLHELAHIRRRDYMVNSMQVMVESFLFYHPAIWWISGVIRAERENCCDDQAIARSGDAHQYATALTALEQNRRSAQEVALAATGGNLVKRVCRILNPLKPTGGPGAVWTPVLSAGILAVTAALALTAWQAPVPAQPTNIPQAEWWQKWVDEDVAYIITDEERKVFEQLNTDDERRYFVDEFWQRRDPTPGTTGNEYKNEHYRRMGYASRFASRSGLPGWKTDRGRIYITFGPPDEIDSHPSGGLYGRSAAGGGGETTTLPFEDWRYRYIEGIGNDVNIEFVDTTMTGEYRMTMDPSEKDSLTRFPGTGLPGKVQ